MAMHFQGQMSSLQPSAMVSLLSNRGFDAVMIIFVGFLQAQLQHVWAAVFVLSRPSLIRR